jgi:hypothetical protein
LHDGGQQEMPEAWPAWPKVPEEPEVEVTEQESPKELEVEDEAGDQPQVTYKLDQF